MLAQLDSVATIPFRLFASNGTAPDTSASSDSVILAVNSATTIVPNSTVSEMNAAHGMYYVTLSASNMSVLGVHALYHTQGSFPQHLANIEVVNSNPFSTQSNILVNDIAADTYSGVTIQGLSNYANISNVTLHEGTHSDVTIQGISNYANISNVTLHAGTHSAATVQGISNYANISNVTLHAGTHSAATVQGVSNYANISNVTLHEGTHSDVTIQGVTRVNSNVTIADAAYSAVTVRVTGIVAASFNAGAIDAAALATDAGQEIADRILVRSVAGGADSSRSVGEAMMALRNRTQLSDVSYIVYQNDDTTIAWHASLSTTDDTVRVTDANPD